MKGYYVIPDTEEPIEISGKNARSRAIKKAKSLIQQGDNHVFIQQFDDDNSNGYMSELEFLSTEAIASKNNDL